MPESISERIYYAMPVAVQNVLFSAYGWRLRRQRYNRYFHTHLLQLKEMEHWPERAIKVYQDKKAAELVRHAYRTVPFYKTFYGDHGVDVESINSCEDLQNLPILTKQLVREHQAQMISSSFNKSSLLKGLTSGTTGTPLSIYSTPEGKAFQWAIWWRHKARFGLSLGDRHLTFGARVPIAQNQQERPYWRHDYSTRRTYLSTYHISRRTVGEIVDYLNSTEFDFFTGYPSAMYDLACLIEEQGLSLRRPPRYVVSGSDALLPGYATTISRVFGAPVTEQYGMAEFAGNMSKCEYANFHVDFECCHIETQPLHDSGLSNLLLTGWGNPAMPFIRYEVGDYAQPTSGPCKCGRQTPTFSTVDGRLEDHIVTPDGRRLIGMNQVFEYATNAREIQIVQEAKDKIEFLVVPHRGFGAEDRNALTREFRRRGGDGINISFKVVDELERSSTGKLKAVISKVAE